MTVTTTTIPDRPARRRPAGGGGAPAAESQPAGGGAAAAGPSKATTMTAAAALRARPAAADRTGRPAIGMRGPRRRRRLLGEAGPLRGAGPEPAAARRLCLWGSGGLLLGAERGLTAPVTEVSEWGYGPWMPLLILFY
jgi:hypothetical protein